MATTVKKLLTVVAIKFNSHIDQHYVKTKVFTTVNDIEAKYLTQPSADFTPSPQSPSAHFIPSSQLPLTQHNTNDNYHKLL